MSYSNIEQRKDTKSVVKNLTKDSLQFSFSGQNKVYTKKENCTDNTIFSLSQVVELIKSQPPIEVLQVRKIVKDGFSNNVDSKVIKSQIKPLKNSLPYILLSGVCKRHHSDVTLAYNGCIQIDIDFKFVGGDIESLRVKKLLEKYKYIVFAAISPSGVGVKALVSTTNKDLADHGKVANALILELSKKLNVDIKYFDKLGASQPCFVPFDFDLYYNEKFETINHYEFLFKYVVEQNAINEKQNAIKLSEAIAKVKRLNDSAKNNQTSKQKSNLNTDVTAYYASELDILRYLASELRRTNTDVTDDRKGWLTTAYSLASLGDNANEYFHKIASLNSTYKYDENQNLFESGKSKKGSFAPFISLCADNNITINDFCKQFVIDNAPKGDTTNKKLLTKVFELGTKEFVGNKLSPSDFKKGLYSIKGGTGTGKSNFAARSFKKTLIVSRNVTTLQNYEQYNFVQFLESDRKDHFAELEASNYERITVTYKSLKKLRKTANLDGYTIFFDEAHILNESYLDVEAETRYAYNSINELSQTNTVILMSANEVYFNNDNTTFVKKYTFKKPSIKRSVLVTYNANFKVLIKKIDKRLKEGKKVLLFTNRTEEKYISQVIKESFDGKTTYFFDATKHGELDLSNLVHDITICTTALVTGKDINNDNIACVFYGLDYGLAASTIIQFFGRARSWELATYDLFFVFKPSKTIQKYSVNRILTGAYDIAIATIKASVNDFAFVTENKDRFVTKKNDELIVSWFDIDTFVQKRVSKRIVQNADNLTKYLSKFNYTTTVIELDDIEVVKVDIESVVKPSELYVLELNEIHDNNEEAIEFLTNVLNRVEAMQKIGFNRSDSIDIANIYRSAAKWKMFVNRLLVEQYYSSEKAIDFRMLYDEVFEAFKDFKTGEQMEQAIKKIDFKKGKNTELNRFLRGDKKEVRTVIKNLNNYFEVAKKQSKKAKLFKIEKLDNLGELNPSATDLKGLFAFCNLLK